MLHLNGRTPGTCVTHVRSLHRFLAEEHPDVGLEEVEPKHLRDFMQHETARGLAPGTRRLQILALRQFYEFLGDGDDNEVNPAQQIKPPRVQRSFRQPLTETQIERLLTEAHTRTEP